jgi:endonuclease/exonuclease/phosphatase family metal-dependent hydrolase
VSRFKTFLVVFAALVCVPVSAEEFRILCWNVESNRPGQPPVSDPATIAAQIKEMAVAEATRFSILVLSEVEPKTVDTFKTAAAEGLGKPVDFVISASGGFGDTDSLMVVVDTTRFEIRDAIELHRYAGLTGNFTNNSDASEPGAMRARSPLAVKLSDKTTSKTFWVIANHLARGEEALRTEQAKMLRQWAKDSVEPIIAAGDFNFDFEFHTQKGNAGFDAMMEGNVWTWLKPDPLIDSNWSDDRQITDRRVDRYPDSILDFVFVANEARTWAGKSSVVVREGDFPDNEKTSDHRPVIATFRIPSPRSWSLAGIDRLKANASTEKQAADAICSLSFLRSLLPRQLNFQRHVPNNFGCQ